MTTDRRHRVIMAGVLVMTCLSFYWNDAPSWVRWIATIFGGCCLIAGAPRSGVEEREATARASKEATVRARHGDVQAREVKTR